jgi:hypothetical protein
MSTAELDTEALIEAVDIAWPQGNYIPHEPTPRQQAFLWLPHIEAMYGGAAGGGKSDAMLMAALQYIDMPGYAALLLRKTYNELMLEGALLDRAQKWLAHTNCQWNGETRRFTFPSGSTITFGYLANMQDRARYQSSEFQFIGFDELTAFEESDYRFMFSRLRKTELQGDIPLRMRSATNPGGKGHKWVFDRFIKPFVDKIYSGKRAFIPAKLSDNPHIDQVSYRAALEELEPELAAQLLEGDWDAREPGNWMMRDPRWVDAAADLGAKLWGEHLNGSKRLPAPVSITNKGTVYGLTNCIDWGEHTQSYIVWPLEHGGVFIPPSEVVGLSEDPVEVTKRIIEQTMQFEYPLKATNYDAAGVQSMRTYVNIMRKLQRFSDLRSVGVPFGKYKREAVWYLRTIARRTYEGETERVLAIHPQNRELIRQLRRWERKDDESDDAVKEDDHGPDALVAGVALIAMTHREQIEKDMTDSYGDTDDAYNDGGGLTYGS